jgi:hypothetical protein
MVIGAKGIASILSHFERAARPLRESSRESTERSGRISALPEAIAE